MHFTYVILPALSLLNMGVEGATIAKALTSRHSSEAHQVRRIVHGRQFHNADFGSGSATPEDKNSPVAQATRHSTRDTLVHNVENETTTSIKDNNGSGADIAPNPDFPDYITGNYNGPDATRPDNLSPKDGVVQNPNVTMIVAQDKTVTDPTTSSLNTNEISDEFLPITNTLTGLGLLDSGADILSLLDTNSLLGTDSLVGTDSLSSLSSLLVTSSLTGVLPERREDDDSDQVQEVVKELELVSTSPANPSTLEGNSVTPQPFERRFLWRKRDDGSLETNIGGEPLFQVENISTDPLTGVVNRGMDIHSPIRKPRDHKPSHLLVRRDVADLGVKALENTLVENEDIGGPSGLSGRR